MKNRFYDDSAKKPSSPAFDSPEVYRIRKNSGNWLLGRRQFLAGAVTVAGASITRSNASPISQPERSVADPSKFKYRKCPEPLAHTGTINAIAFSPDSNYLVSGAVDGKVKIWSLKTGSKEKILKNSGGIQHLAFTPEGKWLVVCTQYFGMRIWDFEQRKKKYIFDQHPKKVMGVDVARDGTFGASVDFNGNVFIWSIPEGELIHSWTIDDQAHCLAISPDGQYLAIGIPGKVSLWSLKPGQEGTFIREFGGYGWNVDRIAFSPDGNYLVEGRQYYFQLGIWSFPGGQEIAEIDTDQDYHFTIATHPTNGLFASGGQKRHLRLWTCPEGHLQKVLGDGGGENWEIVTALAFSNDGKWLASGNMKSYLRLWNTATWTLQRCFIDSKCNDSDVEAVKYIYKSQGKKVKVIIPNCKCRPEMPGKAKCSCDSVAGRNDCECVKFICSCVFHSGGCGSVYYYPN